MTHQRTHRMTRITTLLALVLATSPALTDAIEITYWGAELEWFLETDASESGATGTFVVHATWLENFRPVATGEVTLRMHDRNGEMLSEATAGLDREGIFAVPLILPEAGHYYLTAILKDADGTHENTIGKVHIPGPQDNDPGHDHGTEALDHAHEDGGTITFLKEQQWGMHFATAPAQYAPFTKRLEVPGTIREAPGSRTRLVAPADGVVTGIEGWPEPGRPVASGDELLRLAVLPEGVAVSRITLEFARARERLTAAEAELERVIDLAEEGVVASSRVVEARRERNTAQAELDNARELQERLAGDAESGAIILRAPARGRLESLDVNPGEVVRAGQPLASILDGERLWLVAHLYPSDMELVTTLADPAIRVPGRGDWHTVGGDPIWEGGAFDGPGQTLSVAFALEKAGSRFRPGMPVTVALSAEPPRHRITVPVAALTDDNGVEVVIVQTGGETFERRMVRTGARATGQVEILSGVDAGERVVTRGAYAVLLASRDTGDAGHGHSH